METNFLRHMFWCQNKCQNKFSLMVKPSLIHVRIKIQDWIVSPYKQSKLPSLSCKPVEVAAYLLWHLVSSLCSLSLHSRCTAVSNYGFICTSLVTIMDAFYSIYLHPCVLLGNVHVKGSFQVFLKQLRNYLIFIKLKIL